MFLFSVRTFVTEFKLKKVFPNITMEKHSDLREVENEITKTVSFPKDVFLLVLCFLEQISFGIGNLLGISCISALFTPVIFGRRDNRPLGNRRQVLRTSGPRWKQLFEVALRCSLLAFLFHVQTDSRRCSEAWTCKSCWWRRRTQRILLPRLLSACSGTCSLCLREGAEMRLFFPQGKFRGRAVNPDGPGLRIHCIDYLGDFDSSFPLCLLFVRKKKKKNGDERRNEMKLR